MINFIEIDDRWVLIYCPYQNPVYFVGDFDIDSYRFVPQNKDILSYGYVSQGDEEGGISRGLYATSVLKTADGRSIIFGWVSGFYAPGGWEGCVSLPRQLSLGDDNKVRMVPADEVNLLRKRSFRISQDCPTRCGNTFELVCGISLEEGGEAVISINGDTLIEIKNQTITLNDIIVPCADKNISIRLFVDVSLAELFLNDGALSITRCIKPVHEDAELLIKGKNCNIENPVVHELTI